MTRILFIITRGDVIGGAQSHLLIMCRGFIEKGVEVRVLLGGQNTILKRKLDQLNIVSKELKYLKREISFFNDFISLITITKYIIRFKPSLVSSHSSKSGILARVACLLSKTPNVFTAHGWSFTEGVSNYKRKIYIIIEKIMASITDKIIAVSNYDLNLALTENVCSITKIQLIYNGIIDPQVVKFDNNGVITNLVMVARFDKPKDQLKLINSIKDIDNVVLYLIGDGPNFYICEKFVTENNLTNKVKLVGYIDDVTNFLIKMDVFILISDYEGFPMSTIEAMSVGLPVIISNVGGASEAIIEGINGFIVENNEENIRSAICKLIEDKTLLVNMGRNSHHIYSKNFNSKLMVENTFKLFNNILQK
jgi:glycosyltransferase involved in cell wall biosynthesis